MLGRVCWGDGRKTRLEEERLLGLPVLILTLPERVRGREGSIGKAGRLLSSQRVTRVLTPPSFEEWPTLLRHGLRPVDTRAIRCALTPAWVREILAVRGVTPESAVVLLTGARESSDMARVARALCPVVRNLIIDVPGGGTLAAQLRKEFGIPILPARSIPADLNLNFDPAPVLTGVKYTLAKDRDLLSDCERLPLLSALWESGRIKLEEIVLQV